MVFAATLLIGLNAGNETWTVLVNAIGAMCVCYVVGRIVGAIAQRTLEEFLNHYKQENPLPDVEAKGSSAIFQSSADEQPSVDIVDDTDHAEDRPVRKHAA